MSTFSVYFSILGADVSKMEKGEGERRIYVVETALSQVIGSGKTFIDRQGRRSIAIRNPSTDHGESFYFLCKKGLLIQ